jgi:DNA-binding HxlR family transcriptional regulator
MSVVGHSTGFEDMNRSVAQCLERVLCQDHPPRAEYRLTDNGRDFWRVVGAMRQWGDRGPPRPKGLH